MAIIKIKDRRGVVIDHDSTLPIPDGCGITVAAYLQDGVPTPVDDNDGEAMARRSYEEGKRRLSEAWRTGQAVSWTEPARPVHNARPAYEGWPGPWVNRNPSPKPPDVTRDAAPNAESAYRDLVKRTAEAWRS